MGGSSGGHLCSVLERSAGLSAVSGGKIYSYDIPRPIFLAPHSTNHIFGFFWHQGSRQKFLAPANFVAFSLLRMSHRIVLARYTALSLTFAISGLHHQFCDTAGGVPWREAGAMRFFVMQAAGIMFEDAVQGAYRGWNAQQRTEARPSGFKRVVGACWLFCWLFWTTPAWLFPVAQRSTGRGIFIEAYEVTLVEWIVLRWLGV